MAFLYLFLEICIYYPLFAIMTFKISLLLRYISLIVQTTAMLISFFFLSFFYISLFWNLENNVTFLFLFLFYLLAQYVFLCSPFRSLCSVDFFLIFLCCFFLICSYLFFLFLSMSFLLSILFTLLFFPTLLFVLCFILSLSVYSLCLLFFDLPYCFLFKSAVLSFIFSYYSILPTSLLCSFNIQIVSSLFLLYSVFVEPSI